MLIKVTDIEGHDRYFESNAKISIVERKGKGVREEIVIRLHDEKLWVYVNGGRIVLTPQDSKTVKIQTEPRKY